jgi:hypothetical protein
MDVQLSSLNASNGIWKFYVSFMNDSEIVALIPVDAIKRSGERIGLRFQLDGEEIEPVDFTIISPKNIPEDVELPPKEKLVIEFEGVLEKKREDIYALSFRNAVYRIFPNRNYGVKFEWQNMSSNIVDWQPTAI